MHLRAATLTFALVSLPALALDQHQQVIVERAKAMITRDFKDPSSAQWRGLYLMRGDTLCGEVNAKNSYGGYVGFRRFFAGTALGSAAVEDAPGRNSAFLNAWSTTCDADHVVNGQLVSNGPRADIDPP